MEINTILRKLEPLIPRQVAKWQRTLDIAEPEVKALLERHIRWKEEKEEKVSGTNGTVVIVNSYL